MANTFRGNRRNGAKFNGRNQNQRVGQGVVAKKKKAALKTKGKSVLDARQKIISKKRVNVTDARDVLAKLAKTHDAREKLVKLRQQRNTPNVRPIGSSIIQKTDRNGKISLVTNKNKHPNNDMNLAIRQQLGLVSQNRKRISSKPGLSPETSRRAAAVAAMPRSMRPPVIRKVLGSYDYPPPPPPVQQVYELYTHDYMNFNNISPLHPRVASTSVSSVPIRKKPEVYVGPRSEVISDVYPSHSRNYGSRPHAVAYMDLDAPEDDDMPIEVPPPPPPRQTIFMQSSARNSNVRSRLDSSPVKSESQGIFANMPTKTKVIVPAGHRIVVSNLQPTVTQDDIRELFEDIGQLLVARLVRPGTAEVIYKSLKDAQKAVDTYHNRQLDGQPMKCLLVNKRPLNDPTGPAIMSSKPDSTGYIHKKAPLSKIQRDFTPDVQTIHQVLFSRH